MKRLVPKYFCMSCRTWQIKYPTNIFRLKDTYISHIYCDSCKKWIAIADTNLSTGYRYVVKIHHYPSIMDNDTPHPVVIFQANNIVALKKICNNFNTISAYTVSQASQDYRVLVNASISDSSPSP